MSVKFIAGRYISLFLQRGQVFIALDLELCVHHLIVGFWIRLNSVDGCWIQLCCLQCWRRGTKIQHITILLAWIVIYNFNDPRITEKQQIIKKATEKTTWIILICMTLKAFNLLLLIILFPSSFCSVGRMTDVVAEQQHHKSLFSYHSIFDTVWLLYVDLFEALRQFMSIRRRRRRYGK